MDQHIIDLAFLGKVVKLQNAINDLTLLKRKKIALNNDIIITRRMLANVCISEHMTDSELVLGNLLKSEKELDKEIDDLRIRRDMEFIELSQQNMFEGRQFNPSEFNKIYEKDKKKQEKKLKKNQEKGEIVKVGEEFTAFNDNGLDNFVSVDADYGELFGTDNFRENTLYGKLNDKNNLSTSDISSDDETYNDEYKKHNYDRDTKSTDDRLSQLMRDRELFSNNLKDTKTAGYKDVMEDQFGISRQFGKMIGQDFTQKSRTQKIDSDMVKVYNKMVGYDSENSDDE